MFSKKFHRLTGIALAFVLFAIGAGAAQAQTAVPTAAPTMAATMAATSMSSTVATAAPTASGGGLVVGFVLIGSQQDKGWSQAQSDAIQYVNAHVPGVKTLILDKLNPADRPNTTLEQVVSNMKDEGATLILTTSDDFKTDTLAVAKEYPGITFINISGDDVLTGNAPVNEGNIMGRMEPMKMIAGCAAALATQTNSIAYLGPLINDETRRLASSVFLGAKYCYKTYRNLDPVALKFDVKWIGYWFNIPGVTLDPTQVATSLYDSGADVIISGIDTTEAIVVAGQRASKGDKVYAIPYDYKDACQIAPTTCLGVPYFNWGPAYAKLVTNFQAGNWKQAWDWNPPDWKNINSPDTSAVGFVFGDALTADQKTTLNKFIADMGSGNVNLFTGPINYQDGTPYLKTGEAATDQQIWYMKQLLQGMTGDSQPPAKK